VTTKKKGRQLFWQKKCTPRQNPGYACHQIGASINQKTSSPWAMKLSWQHIYIAFSMMTYKPSKVGHNDLVFGLWSEFVRRSVHAGIQVSTYSSYDCCHPG